MNTDLTTLANLLFEEATKGGDGFRQWVYPDLPVKYETNPDILVWGDILLLEYGYTPEQAFTHIMKYWRIRQTGRYCSFCMTKDD